MILDNIAVTGTNAYLKDTNGNINLGANNSTGTSPTLGSGIVIDISSITMLLESNDLYALMKRRSAPLMRIDLVKEIFPGLFRDPYKSRVHTIAGYDDFNRGVFSNCKMMEVDGFPTLVNFGSEECKWESEIYIFDQLPQSLNLDAASWNLASSKLTPDDGFTYSITINIWQRGDSIRNPPTVSQKIADQLKPKGNRFLDGFGTWAQNIYAYQIEFKAKVFFDAYLKERYSSHSNQLNMGRPLLRAINFIEPIPSLYEFYSLNELLFNCNNYELLQQFDGNPKNLTASLAITAALEENESISVTVLTDEFYYVEAMLDARMRVKPPVIDK